jgi:gas vesicle protein
MGQGTEELTAREAEIEATRADLSRNIDELGDKVSPQRAMQRRTEAARGRLGSLRDRIMGSASSAGGSVASSTSSMGGSVGSAASSVGERAQGAAGSVQARTEGNPLAAGLMAFGAGMVLSALFPASEKETGAAQRAVETAKEHGQPVVDEAKSVSQDVGQHLAQEAKQSADQVQESARESVEEVKNEGQDSAENLKSEAQPSSDGPSGKTGASQDSSGRGRDRRSEFTDEASAAHLRNRRAHPRRPHVPAGSSRPRR